MASLISRALVITALSSSSCAQGVLSAGTQQLETPSANVRLEDLEQRLGPFSINLESFTIVLHEKRLSGAADPNFAETLAQLEIQDRSGSPVYQKSFPYKVEGGRFRRSVTASVRLLPGKNLTGLLVRYVVAPPAPDGWEAWQVFRFRSGKLGVFDGPSDADLNSGAPGPFGGVFIRGGNGATPMPLQASRADSVELRVWTGSFYVVVPMRVDWAAGKLMPGERCFELSGGHMIEKGCDLRVEAERRPSSSEFNFLRMFHETVENKGDVRHVVVTRDSKVEILGARAVLKWSGEGDLMKVGFSDLWLKVLIDDDDEKEGWIHTSEDFSAVGLPSRSPGR
ncbi:MAG TPA: hypothetical protein VHM88_13245 [Candidatus Acidoferrales bacterium]|jgi:hypothetical protein|nr:hypothetical protein [Candidatus Acidoferrales bacterium]